MSNHLKKTRIGDRWYKLTGHPNGSIGVRRHHASLWGWYLRDGKAATPDGQEFFAPSYSAAVSNALNILNTWNTP